jgi:hypothetical protein
MQIALLFLRSSYSSPEINPAPRLQDGVSFVPTAEVTTLKYVELRTCIKKMHQCNA